MDNIIYSVTGPSIDGMFGIAGSDQTTGENAVAMHFLANRLDAERLVEVLNVEQRRVSDFCNAFLSGDLKELI